MNRYKELKARQQEEFNKLPIKYAFDTEQFNKGMQELGLNPTDTDAICIMNGGAFIRKDDIQALHQQAAQHKQELIEAIEADKDGSGFIYEMFFAELINHEFQFTDDISSTLEAIGFTAEQIEADERLSRGLHKAINYISLLDF